jgi:type I restriction enzyme, R subunit
MKKHSEARLEEAIVEEMVVRGGYAFVDYNAGAAKDAYDVAKALDPDLVLSFIEKTQPKPWNSLKAIHGDSAGEVLIDDLCKELETKGMLKVLRQGFKCFGKKFRVAYFAPSNAMNPDTQARYEANVLSVTRQLYYSPANRNSLDLVLFLNGLPVVTMELKNHLSGQTVEDAKKQYKRDRDPKELLFQFKKRALVHFVVDPDHAYMTTRLSHDKTYFLPFNLGHNNRAGNPTAEDNGYRTAYLWREVLQRDSLLDILGRFMHLEVKEKRILTDKGIKKVTQETMIFPRYHQLDAVRKIVAHTKAKGTGCNYLVQHSAGSGKSNSIAWLAHRLSSLHNSDDAKIFDSVIVVTDRRVLDQQLQNTIYQFDHKQGVVEKIDEDTRQLVRALAGGTPIIITTLQKFPFVSETLEKLRADEAGLKISTKDKRFAVIVDEAHSSQSGESAMELKGVLNRESIEEDADKYAKENAEDGEDPDQLAGVVREMMKRSKQENLSFYAFTATPKFKTKQVFDEPGTDGKSPFHLYSMRQAIEEGFILDVLKNYTTYETYYRIVPSER